MSKFRIRVVIRLLASEVDNLRPFAIAELVDTLPFVPHDGMSLEWQSKDDEEIVVGGEVSSVRWNATLREFQMFVECITSADEETVASLENVGFSIERMPCGQS